MFQYPRPLGVVELLKLGSALFLISALLSKQVSGTSLYNITQAHYEGDQYIPIDACALF